MFHMRSKPSTVQLGKYKLSYRRYGSGPSLVLIHGLSGSATWWRRNMPALSKYFTVYALELVGYGGNRAWRPVNITDTAEAINRFIEQLPGGCADVVGHSMGGQIATQLAGLYPHRVDRLVLACASGLVQSDLLHMMLRLPSTGRYTSFDFAPVLTYDALRAGPVNLLLSTLDILSNDVSEALKAIVAPTLLIWGAQDKLVPVSVGEAVHKAVRGSRLEVIQGAGHVVMWDRAAEFNRLVLDFLLAPQAQNQPNAVGQLAPSP